MTRCPDCNAELQDDRRALSVHKLVRKNGYSGCLVIPGARLKAAEIIAYYVAQFYNPDEGIAL